LALEVILKEKKVILRKTKIRALEIKLSNFMIIYVIVIFICFFKEINKTKNKNFKS